MGNSLQAERLGEVMLEQAPGCNWLLDGDLRFVRVRGNALPLFHRAAPDLVGIPLAEVLPQERGEAWRERLMRVLAGETLVVRERHADAIFSIVHFPVRLNGGDRAHGGGFAIDTTAIAQAEHELRNTAVSMMKTQEAERARLSRLLHDDVGQCLSAAGLQLDLLRMDMEESVPAITARTAEVQQMLEKLMERIRDFSNELAPPAVERTGLYSALDRLAGRTRREFRGVVRLMADSTLKVPPAAAPALYRIAQEAVENSVRHSGAALIEILLKSTRGGPVLEIRDNGRGFNMAGESGYHPGLGLLIMEHFAAEAGLELSVASNRNKGTVVRASYSGAGSSE